jgi:hypothetical protein
MVAVTNEDNIKGENTRYTYPSSYASYHLLVASKGYGIDHGQSDVS